MRRFTFSSLFTALGIALASACSPPVVQTDGARDGDASDALADSRSDTTSDSSGVCTDDSQCRDGTYCNGAERCMPGAIGADARGCIAGTSPCTGGATCNEAMQRCSTNCGDADGDGHGARSCGGDDCDDNDAQRFPGNPEVCDAANHDEDCEAATFGLRDNDGDGYFDRACCNVEASGTMRCGADCDDSRPNVHPGATEACDGLDNDCSGTPDDGIMRTCWTDSDGDGFGDPMARQTATGCTLPSGCVENSNDCDDAHRSANPSAPEVCDGIDNNCNGMSDEAVSIAFYPDCDGDGFGDVAATSTVACLPTDVPQCMGHYAVINHTDCDDTRGSSNPAAPEVCNGADDNCDGLADNGLATYTYYADCDGDGFGRTATSVTNCARPTSMPSVCGSIAYAGWSLYAGDCDDTQFATYPGAVERCDGIDNNCDGTNGEDADGDGHIATSSSCARGAGFFLPIDDCRDDIASVHGGVTQYFGTPACPPGSTPCMYNAIMPPAGSTLVLACIPPGQTCPIGTGGNPGACLGGCPTSVATATFDYDCSGATSPQPSTMPACASPTRTGLCIGSGVNYSTAPQCGYPVSTWSCPISFAPSCAAPTSTNGPMPCR